MFGVPQPQTPKSYKGYTASSSLLTASRGTPYKTTKGFVTGIKTRLNNQYGYHNTDNDEIVNWLQANEAELENMAVDDITRLYFEDVTEKTDSNFVFDEYGTMLDDSSRFDDIPGSPMKIGEYTFQTPPMVSPADIKKKRPVLGFNAKQQQASVLNDTSTQTNSLSTTPQPTTITQTGPNQRGLKDVRQTFLRSPQAMAQASAIGLDLNNQADFETFLRMSQQSIAAPVDVDERDQLTVYGVKRVKSKPPKKFNMRSATVY